MRTFLITLLLSSLAVAQYPPGANTLRWNGVTSTSNFCWGFTCTPDTATLFRGETGSLFIRAEFQQPYAIAFSLTATRCLSVTGILNSLVIDDPFAILVTGTCSQPSPILSCPGGFDTIPVSIPLTWTPGLTLSIQGITGIPGSFQGATASFTRAITFTVQ